MVLSFNKDFSGPISYPVLKTNKNEADVDKQEGENHEGEVEKLALITKRPVDPDKIEKEVGETVKQEDDPNDAQPGFCHVWVVDCDIKKINGRGRKEEEEEARNFQESEEGDNKAFVNKDYTFSHRGDKTWTGKKTKEKK